MQVCVGTELGGLKMRSLRLFGTTIAAAVICIAPPASAATVKALSGQVLLNRGDGYKLVAGQAEAAAGATVVANPGASAQIVYPDGCVVDLKPTSVATVMPQSPCKDGATADAGSGASSGSGSSSGSGGGLGSQALVLGAVAVGGGVAAALLLGQKNNSASGQ